MYEVSVRDLSLSLVGVLAFSSVACDVPTGVRAIEEVKQTNKSGSVRVQGKVSLGESMYGLVGTYGLQGQEGHLSQ